MTATDNAKMKWQLKEIQEKKNNVMRQFGKNNI